MTDDWRLASTDADWSAVMAVLGLPADDITMGLQVPLEPTLPQALVVTADVLNVRSGPGAGYSRIGQLAQGALVDGWHQAGNWVLVTSGDVAGWCSKKWVEVSNE